MLSTLAFTALVLAVLFPGADPAEVALSVDHVPAEVQAWTLPALDRLVEEVRIPVEAETGAARAAVLCRLLYAEDAFGSPGPSDLPGVMRARHGDCVGLALLGLAIGYRLGLPLVAVAEPGHLYLRYEEGGITRAFDPTAHGAERTEEAPIGGRGSPSRALRGPAFRAYLLAERAARLFRAGVPREAASAVKDALHLDPSCPKALAIRAFLRAAAGDPAGALQDAREVTAHDPRHAGVWALQGALLAASDEPEEAVACAEAAVFLAPEVPAFQEVLALALTAAGRGGEADRARWQAEALRTRENETSTVVEETTVEDGTSRNRSPAMRHGTRPPAGAVRPPVSRGGSEEP